LGESSEHLTVAKSGAVLGVDVGTSSAKVVLIDQRGAVLRSASGEYPMVTPQPGWTEQNPEDWQRAVQRCIKDIDAPAGTPIGFTGQMHGAVFLDSQDRVIRPAPLWNDQRTTAECAAIERTVGAEVVRTITGNPPLTSFQLPKLLWLRANEPQNAKRVASLLLPKDYVRLKITGERMTDVTDASGTGAFDLKRRAWSKEILRAVDVDEEVFPPARESAEAASAGDQAAAAVGTGAVAEGVVSVSIGTSGVVFSALDQLRDKRDDAVNLFCHATGRWHAMTVMLSAGGALRWLRDTIYDEETSYDEIMKDADSIATGSEGLTFLPYLAGERSPHNDPSARGAFVGLALHHTRAHLARAVVEGITFGLLDGLNALRRVTGVQPNEVRVTGGGARSAAWRQLIANVFGMPVLTLVCEEGPAFGAALLAGVRDGVWPSVESACDAAVRTHTRTEPTGGGASFDEAYDRFRGLYPVLATLCHPERSEGSAVGKTDPS
jgi:xylulokinase